MPIIAALRAIVALVIAGIAAITTTTVAPVPETRLAEPNVYEEIPTPELLPEIGIQGTSDPRTDLKAVELPRSDPAETPEVSESKPPAPEPIQFPGLSTAVIDTQTKGAVTHLLCRTERDRSVRVVTGSGVIIDPRGIVLTNAHVAQFWLFPEESLFGKTDCRVRAAVPVDREYRAELLYLPADWIAVHAKDITNPNPKGTGEHDYALLRIIEPVSKKYIFPAVFPFVTYVTSDAGIDKGDEILIAAYPATDSDASADELAVLDIASSEAAVEDVFTFTRSTLDLMSLGASALSFKGSSGGAVMNGDNELIGIITTSTAGETAEERELRAITLAHINRSLMEHIGVGFKDLLSGNIGASASAFNQNVAPALAEMLLSEL